MNADVERFRNSASDNGAEFYGSSCPTDNRAEFYASSWPTDNGAEFYGSSWPTDNGAEFYGSSWSTDNGAEFYCSSLTSLKISFKKALPAVANRFYAVKTLDSCLSCKISTIDCIISSD